MLFLLKSPLLLKNKSKMLKNTLFIFILFPFLSFAQVNFQDIDIEEAKKQALAQNKEIFIDFRADWCKPCIQMENETFTDLTVIKYLNSNFINIKADVDYFKFADMAEDFNVGNYPTLLVLDAQGNVQKRMIGFKSAKALLEEFGQYQVEEEIEEGEKEESPTTQPIEVKKRCKILDVFKK